MWNKLIWSLLNKYKQIYYRVMQAEKYSETIYKVTLTHSSYPGEIYKRFGYFITYSNAN